MPPIRLAVSAPGKVILHGEHSVVYGKLALAASLSLRTRLDLDEARSSGDEIRLELPDIEVSYSLGVSELSRLVQQPSLLLTDSVPFSAYNWENPDLIDRDRFVAWLKEAVIKDGEWNAGQLSALVAFHFLLIGLLSGVNVSVRPLELRISSDLSIGSGLGSSASYSVCLAAGLYLYIKSCVVRAGHQNQDIAREGFRPCLIASEDLSSLNARERDLVERWAKVSDGIMHGTASGVDTATIATGGVVEFRRSQEGQPLLSAVPHAALLKIVLVDSGVCRNTKRMVEQVRALKARLPDVVAPLLDAMDGVAVAARSLLTQTDCMAGLGELVELNHHLLRALGVSHPSLEDICVIASRHGLSGKLTGAGGGGYAFILLPPSTAPHKVASLLAELEGGGYRSLVTSLGGPGVQVEG